MNGERTCGTYIVFRINKNEIMLSVAMWIDLDINMLSEISQTNKP